MNLNTTVINQLVVLLRPFMNNEQERKSCLILALGTNHPILNRIEWTGATDPFIVNMINLVNSDNQLLPLLDQIKSMGGVEHQQAVDNLKQQLQNNSPSSAPYIIDKPVINKPKQPPIHKRVLRIVVASPGDVQQERELLANSVIPELNQGIASYHNLILELARWETDAYPGFHLEGGQALIDSVLNIEQCDILIGIFWKRFGSPTKDGTTGTEHEFLTAYNAWKQKQSPQIMMYFKQAPYTLNSDKEVEQVQKVLSFRQRLQEQGEGLYWTYEKEDEFKDKVRLHLTKIITRLV